MTTYVARRTALRPEIVWARADAIKEARWRLGLTQTQFGALFGLSKATVVNWELGQSLPPTLEKLGLVGRAGTLPEPKTTQTDSPYQEIGVGLSEEAA